MQIEPIFTLQVWGTPRHAEFIEVVGFGWGKTTLRVCHIKVWKSFEQINFLVGSCFSLQSGKTILIHYHSPTGNNLTLFKTVFICLAAKKIKVQNTPFYHGSDSVLMQGSIITRSIFVRMHSKSEYYSWSCPKVYCLRKYIDYIKINNNIHVEKYLYSNRKLKLTSYLFCA